MILDSTCLLDVYLKINEKNDEYKKFYEQFEECLKLGTHENFANDQDAIEQEWCDAWKLKDEMARTDVHLENKKEGWKDNYIITDERDTLEHRQLECKNESRHPKEARFT